MLVTFYAHSPMRPRQANVIVQTYPVISQRQIRTHTNAENLELTFPSTSEEHLYNEHLQCCHGHHQPTLDQTEVEDSPFRALYSTEISVLAGAEILLLSRKG